MKHQRLRLRVTAAAERALRSGHPWLFAEKIRAMAQRGRPRDLYDIVNLFRRNDLRLYPDEIENAEDMQPIDYRIGFGRLLSSEGEYRGRVKPRTFHPCSLFAL